MSGSTRSSWTATALRPASRPARCACSPAAADWTARFQPIAAALAVPKIRAAYLDGKIAVMGRMA